MVERIPEFISKQWSDLLADGDAIDFRPGQVLFYEGHDPYGVFVVLQGKVETICDKKKASKDPLWLSQEGEVFGLSPLLYNTPFCCTGTALTNCKVIFLPKILLHPILEKIKNNPTDHNHSCG